MEPDDSSLELEGGDKTDLWIRLVLLLGVGAGIGLWAYSGSGFYFVEGFVLFGVLAVIVIAFIIEVARALWKG